MSRIKLLLDVVEDMRSLADSIQAVAEAVALNAHEDSSLPEKTEPPKKEVPKITLEQLRTRLGEISRAGYTSGVQGLIQRYGVTHLSKIDPKDYTALLHDAEDLLNGT